ncbi:hypothetical protein PLEOSDRAFT_1069633 [Pleurotus ostreatus PC15]|uniref:Uncharacterized protein n=1 Tax=Pleurotus ostreatus (strain PC15) TaxID=1137138 RepID=A0A067PD14_PLEO1|nr:hypothetical protein PLEOSDRAFT_1069633 [Pleurotus ostreatus PC15]
MHKSGLRSKGKREHRASTEYAVEKSTSATVHVDLHSCIWRSSVFMGYGYDILVNGVAHAFRVQIRK